MHQKIARLIPLDKHMQHIDATDKCSACGAPVVEHFNGEQYLGCPAYAIQQTSVTRIAEALFQAALAEGKHLRGTLADLPSDVREQYRTAAGLAMSFLGLLDPRR